MSTFDQNCLQPSVPVSLFDDNTKVVSFAHLTNKENRDELENVVIHIRILSVTAGNDRNKANISWCNQALGKRKFHQPASFHDILFGADVHNPPNCGVIITRTAQETAFLLEKVGGQRIVGEDFVIHEPDLTTQTLGAWTPIISIKNKQLLPLKLAVVNEMKEANKVNPHDLEVGQGAWFMIKQRQVSLRRATLWHQASCTGIQCDRQKDKGECTCLHATGGKTFVYSFDVSTPLQNNELCLGTSSLTVHAFKSLLTTKCFFKNHERRDVKLNEESSLINLLRPRFTKMVKMINNNCWNNNGTTDCSSMS